MDHLFLGIPSNKQCPNVLEQFHCVGTGHRHFAQAEPYGSEMGGVPFGASWQNEDQKGHAKFHAAFGVFAAPTIIFLMGPAIVSWLNSHGIVLNL